MNYWSFNETRCYNNLLQLTHLTTTTPYPSPQTVMDLQYVYTAGQNNGRIAQSVDGVLGETVNYTYDSLNQLAKAETATSAWGSSYQYDGFGNLTSKLGTANHNPGPPLVAMYDPATNRQMGVSYDANGNPTEGGYNSWDMENRLVVSATDGNTMWGYDPWGKRVMKNGNAEADKQAGYYTGTWEFTFYGMRGQRLATVVCLYDNGPQHLYCGMGEMRDYFGGRLLWTRDQTTNRTVVARDRLGSVRAVKTSAELSYLSYYPYGEERGSSADGREKFGTYFRDLAGQTTRTNGITTI